MGCIGERHGVGDGGVGARCAHCLPNLAIFFRQIKKMRGVREAKHVLRTHNM